MRERLLAAAAERVYRRWKAQHPNASQLDELAAIWRIGGSVLRHGGRIR